MPNGSPLFAKHYMQTYDQIMLSLKQGKYAPVYVLHGDESFYIDMVCNWIEKNVLDEMAREFDQSVVYGKDLAGADIAPVISSARGFAMMGGKKVVIVKEAQNVKKWEALSLYLDNPQPETILVICYKYGKIDGRLGVWKKVEKMGGVMMQSDKLRENQVEAWIRNYIQRRQAEEKADWQVDEKVPKLLADSIGTDLTAVVGALQKLIDGRPDGANLIDAALVERNVGISKDYNIFELQDAFIKGDVLKANRITQYFASSKDHPMVKELGIIYNFFANLMIYHYLPDKTDRVVAPILGVSPFFVKDYAAAAKRYSAGKTFKIIGYFRETDARLKGIDNPSAKDEDLWKELVYKILH